MLGIKIFFFKLIVAAHYLVFYAIINPIKQWSFGMQNEKTVTPEEFYAERKEAGKLVDPEIAVSYRITGSILDPYGVYPPFEEDNIGKLMFAYTPQTGSVCYYDLPKKTLDRLRERDAAGLTDPYITKFRFEE
jgi:hypothetical protein